MLGVLLPPGPQRMCSLEALSLPCAGTAGEADEGFWVQGPGAVGTRQSFVKWILESASTRQHNWQNLGLTGPHVAQGS